MRPIPSNVNLQKERPVCIAFKLEGHGDHYSLGNLQKERPVCMAFKLEGHGDHYFAIMVNDGVVVLLATTGYYTTKAQEYYTTTYAALKYNSATSYITKKPEYFTEDPIYYNT
ncbi:hypothetical protein DAPPUDRAFT_247288 [Daphnia pulex]|uniref:Uncharacterized protein n=1 Tax=Daphnia pulex TaxID=6669 RepID=E9GS58_DAPPU|nr:hypothetical protein DAPPUDRAFT_247288 [Daphnia pulex]|eukprot:EFX77727.1 hypothetical protein DAPPUDRAFT_247288 [Daphnia pulex]